VEKETKISKVECKSFTDQNEHGIVGRCGMAGRCSDYEERTKCSEGREKNE
jgi:hypothetical protein